MRTVRVFVSSPADVAQERFVARGVLERLQGEFAGRLKIETLFWEFEPLLATADFQTQIPAPDDSEIFLTILWSRLGSPLPDGFRRADGSRFASGTEFEFETALAAYESSGRPDILVYRKTTSPVADLGDEAAVLEMLEQKRALDRFVHRWFLGSGSVARHAYHTFEELDRFEAVLESHLRKLLRKHLELTADVPVSGDAGWTAGSPFRGLSAFEFEHAAVFFGRTKATAEILDALRAQARTGRAFVLVLGMSGVGKSSVVRAGVVPMLTRRGVVTGVSQWVRAVCTPADEPAAPLSALARAICQTAALPRLKELVGETELRRMLFEHPEGLVPLLRYALDDDRARVLLVVDQLEELFTHGGDDDGIRAFVHALAVLANSGRVWVVATLRSDFYPRCEEIPELMALKEGRGQYDLAPPTPNEISQMIRLPAQAAGLRFEENPDTGERLDDVLRDHASLNPDMLPLLEFTLDELYQRRTPTGLLTFSAYDDIGRLEGSIARRAEEVYRSLPDDTGAELEHILNRLVSRRGGENAGVRVPVDELSGRERSLVEAFVAARLFVNELDESGRAITRIAHESLIRRWPRIQTWLVDNEENLRLHARLTDAAERWRTEPSPELLLPDGKPLEEARLLIRRGVDLAPDERRYVERSEQRVRRNHRLRSTFAGALALLAVAALIGAGVAFQQSRRAQIEAQTAQATSSFLIRLFEVSDPWTASSAPREITTREILDRGAVQIVDELSAQPRVRANLQQAMGAVYQGLGDSAKAKPLLADALETRRALLGPDHPEVAQTLQALALNAYQQADFPLAEQRLREAMTIWERWEGDDSLGRAAAMNELSIVLASQDRYEEALAVQRQALAVQEARPDVSSIELANAYNNLGFVLMNADRYTEAVSALERAVAVTQETPNVALKARTIANLAAAHQVMGHLDEARRLHEEALALKQAWFEPSNPEIGYSLNNLAWVVRAEGNLERAIELYEAALENFTAALGTDHLNVSIVRGNLARTLLEAGNYQQALDAFETAREGVISAAGARSSYMLPILVGLGRTYQELGRADLALEQFQQAVDIGEEVNARGWDLGVALGLLAAAPDGPYTDEEREQLFERAMGIVTASGGRLTGSHATILIAYARFLQEMGQGDAAQARFLQGLEIDEARLEADDPLLAERRAEFDRRFGAGANAVEDGMGKTGIGEDEGQ